MNNEKIIKAAAQFVGEEAPISIEPIGNGLIHQTYKAKNNTDGKAVVLQAINTNIFKSPEDITLNYKQIYEHLQQHTNGVKIPAPIATKDNHLIWKDEINTNWRATKFIFNSRW